MTQAETITPRKRQRGYSIADAEAYGAYLCALPRGDFRLFRKVMRPNLLWGPWTDEIADELQMFVEDLVAGRRPKLALMSPPQHGKSLAATDLAAWAAGKYPGIHVIFASYADELGIRTNIDLQRIMASEAYRKIFPWVEIGAQDWQCNTSLIEFPGYDGSFRNTTVNGSITGLGLHLGIVDDPVKGRAEASSKQTRDKTWAWYTDDFLSRFHHAAGQLVIYDALARR